ncbi:transposase [Sphingobium sp.]|uniref:transposase n=1 Tax=Sphingobium sp. TaxID=1912891 RepID=UPI0039C90F1E
MDRFVLTDAQWAQMEPHCLGKATDPGRSGRNNRLFMEAVLWIVRTGRPLRRRPDRRHAKQLYCHAGRARLPRRTDLSLYTQAKTQRCSTAGKRTIRNSARLPNTRRAVSRMGSATS